MTSKLEKLQQERDRLNAQIQRLAARKQADERALQRKRDLLVGVFIRQRLAVEQALVLSEPGLLRELDGWLTRDGDRALFGLAPLPKEPKEPKEPMTVTVKPSSPIASVAEITLPDD